MAETTEGRDWANAPFLARGLNSYGRGWTIEEAKKNCRAYLDHHASKFVEVWSVPEGAEVDPIDGAILTARDSVAPELVWQTRDLARRKAKKR